MGFVLPEYRHPDFNGAPLAGAPAAVFCACPADGVAPAGFHATSVFPEYVRMQDGHWELLRRSRMDCVIRLGTDGRPEVTEFRRLRKGDMVAVGRAENGEQGIYLHTGGFEPARQCGGEAFAFRTGTSRETSFSIAYDTLYDIMRHDRSHGRIIWVAGPAVVFDSDARAAFCRLIDKGYVHGLLAGNALATHDLEGALFNTALGQGIYDKRQMPLGHYHHLDTLNTLREAGGIERAVQQGQIRGGVMHALTRQGIPYVLAGSIRDDGPLPEVEPDVYSAQDAMRNLAGEATTVVALATQLHTIATGNMTPSYQVTQDGGVRPVYFFIVDMSEFAAGKLADRGSLTAHAILTNVQDFMVNLDRAL